MCFFSNLIVRLYSASLSKTTPYIEGQKKIILYLTALIPKTLLQKIRPNRPKKCIVTNNTCLQAQFGVPTFKEFKTAAYEIKHKFQKMHISSGGLND